MNATIEDTVSAHLLLARLPVCVQSLANARAAALIGVHDLNDDPEGIEAFARDLEDSCSGYEPMALDVLQLAAAVRLIGATAASRRRR
ncbi:hypothetical protein P7B02_02325 [Caulobacter segnis]|uniref:hypothetical protein n=1 Tax=Caulobacter segnis TaxID=88688 RepID=UPI0024102E60|nr:hypothetical protein [Caulobacter segnis]MDG2520363.1 hypothetical protein [Caulobacter segnis]